MAPSAHQAVARMGRLSGALLLAACRPSSTNASVDGDSAPSATDARVFADAIDKTKRLEGTPSGDAKAPVNSAALKEDCSASPLGPMKHDRASAIAFVCGGRTKCRAYKWNALPSPAGGMRAVVSLWVGDDVDPNASFEDQPDISVEQWLVAALPGSRLTRRILTTDSGLRGDSQHPDTPAGTVEVRGERVKYFLSHFAESNWFSDSAAEFALDPAALVSESAFNGNRMGPCEPQVITWNWKSFSGSVTWAREAAKGELLPGERAKITTGDMPVGNCRCLEFDYDIIPDVRIDGAFTGAGWKATALGDCALVVDGSKDHGFATFGKPASRDDASFRAVLSGWTLFVEVRDDVFTGPTARWVNDDHLEIWLGSEADGNSNGALLDEAASEKLYEQQFPIEQWGIRVVDARVFPAAGNPTAPLTAERFQVDPNTMRFRIKLPSPFKTITVVYSDSDDARGQKTLLATSRLIYDVGSSLGVTRTIDPARAKCAVINGRLEPVLAPTPGPECPLLGGESP